jgi:hypothetical protein
MTPGAVRRCTRILWPGKASEKTSRGVISPVCVKYRRTPQENKKDNLDPLSTLALYWLHSVPIMWIGVRDTIARLRWETDAVMARSDVAINCLWGFYAFLCAINKKY